MLDMGPIDAATLARWITDRARATGASLDLIVAASIVRLAGPRTRDVVQLARAVWDLARPNGQVARDAAGVAMEVLVREQGALHQRQWDALTETGRQVLVALAADPDARLLATDTLRVYNLGSKSTVAGTLEALVEREVLLRETSGGASAGYRFDDPFFRRWVEVNALPDLGRSAPPLPDGTPD